MAERVHRAPGGALTIRVHEGDPTVLVVQGDLDVVGLELFRRIVDPLLIDGVEVHADLRHVEFASLRAATYLVGDGFRTVAVVSPSPAVERAVHFVRPLGEVESRDGH